MAAFKILPFQNPKFKILAFQNLELNILPDFKMLDFFKILAFQNPEFKILALILACGTMTWTNVLQLCDNNINYNDNDDDDDGIMIV